MLYEFELHHKDAVEAIKNIPSGKVDYNTVWRCWNKFLLRLQET